MAASFHAFYLLPQVAQLIAIVPPNITFFVGWNERYKVGVRDGDGAKRNLPKFTSNVAILEWGLVNTKYSNLMMPDFLV